VGLLDTGSSATQLAVGLDYRVLAFTGGLAILTCLLFGVAPAVTATRGGRDTGMQLTARAITSGREAVAMRRALVVAQVALSVVLLFGSLLFARSLHSLKAVDPGFRATGIVAAEIGFSRMQLPEANNAIFRRTVLDRVRAIPGVEHAALVSVVPMSGYSASNTVWSDADPSRRFTSRLNTVGPGYCETMGIPLMAGRDFNDADTRDAPLVAIVNEAFVAALGGGPKVIGTRFTREPTPRGPAKTFEIVGIMRNSKYTDLRERDEPVAFLADAQMPQPPYLRVAIRSAIPAASVTAALTRMLADVDPRIVTNYEVLSAQIDDSLVRDRMLARLSAWFGVLAAVLTLSGLYGLMAYTVSRRTNEIGIRLALGAAQRNIVRLMIGEVGLLVAVGALAGALLAYAAGRGAATLVFGVAPSDGMALGGAIAVLAAIALLAAYLPTRRATRIEPVIALRQE